MSTVQLKSEWELSFADPETGADRTVSAEVPGNIAADLMRGRIIPDLYVGANALVSQKWERTDFTYATKFAAPALDDGERLELLFEGIDTVADIVLNGKIVGIADNMFIPHAIDITRTVKEGGINSLEVRIHNIIDAAASKAKEWGAEGLMFNTMLVNGGTGYESLYVRKSRHMFGWDIAPRILFGGIWRPVHLRVRRQEEILPDEFYWAVTSCDVEKKRAMVNVGWGVSLDPSRSWGKYELALSGSCGESSFSRTIPVRFTHGIIRGISIDQAKFWWPHGYGKANLYDLTLTLKHDGNTVDEYKTRVGVRTVGLDFNCEPGHPEKNRFQFVVNNTPIFVRGSNWVPADALHACDEKRIPEILDLFRDSGCNIVRIWGGGVYEDHAFFNYCDGHGILVWQDFMFACARYPQHEEFLGAVRREAETIIRRLRNHASLALWAGDNEIDDMLVWGKAGRAMPSDNSISRSVLASATVRFDPYRPYLPSSPYISDESYRMGGSNLQMPEQHLWGPRGYFKADFYSRNTAIFASEVGYHGMPAKTSMEKFLSPDKVWGTYNNDEWLVHATEPSGRTDGECARRNFLMLNQAKSFFGENFKADDLDKFVLASQIVQAEAKKYFIEHFRLRRPKKTGIIWWNMIDCWPQFSDAVVDYYYYKKLAYHYIKASQQDMLLMMDGPAQDHCALRVSNDTLESVSGTYSVRDAETNEIVSCGDYAADSNGACDVARIPISQDDRRLFIIEWSCNGKTCRNHYLTGRPPFSFERYAGWLHILQKEIYNEFPLDLHCDSIGRTHDDLKRNS
ncbi:MAG: hypothetical protein WAX69_23090 [Victivallales bacterium]